MVPPSSAHTPMQTLGLCCADCLLLSQDSRQMIQSLHFYLRLCLLPLILQSVNQGLRVCVSPCGARAPLFFPLSIYFPIISPLYFSLYFIGFTYFLLLSIPSLSTRIVPLRFQARGRRKRPNLGLVCCVCVICIC